MVLCKRSCDWGLRLSTRDFMNVEFHGNGKMVKALCTEHNRTGRYGDLFIYLGPFVHSFML